MISLFNTLTRKKEEFRPILPGHAGLYSCGPTVYDYAHIGNLRSYLFSDILRRTLAANGLKVKFVMNITDVDDKTIRKSKAEGKPLKEVTEFYTTIFLEDLARLNIAAPDVLPKATDEIPGMVDMVKILLDKGVAYKTDSGDIYFDISKSENYGRLAHLDFSQLKQNADGRLDKADEYEKEDARDFALWKAYAPDDGDVFWETDVGKGRPGWHIECSVMSTRHLGQPFDLHAGAVDLIFPHHTNEIAQSEATSGKPLANYWVHPEHLLVDNAKMSKSKANFYTSKDVLDKGLSMMAFRYLILSTHYRSKLNFTWDSLQASQNALSSLYQELSALPDGGTALARPAADFMQVVNDDLNTAKGLAILWGVLGSSATPADKLATLLKFDEILGLGLKQSWESASKLPDDVQRMVTERNQARTGKDFAKSDELRLGLESNGYIVEDSAAGTIIKRRH